MAPLVEGFASTADHLDERQDALVQTCAETVDEMRSVLDVGRQFADAEAARFRSECRATEASTVSSLSAAITNASARAFDGRVRALDRRTAAMVMIAMVACLTAGAAGGWWSGVTTTRAAITETETGLRVAFRDGPETAQLWLELMSWNDLRTAILRCRDRGQVQEEGGRKTCRLLFWLSPPPAVPSANGR